MNGNGYIYQPPTPEADKPITGKDLRVMAITAIVFVAIILIFAALCGGQP